MIAVVAAVAAFALLFVLYGLVRVRSCGSDCGACARPCTMREFHDEQS